jgi:hypothetical protein
MYIGILLEAHPILHISRIRVNTLSTTDLHQVTRFRILKNTEVMGHIASYRVPIKRIKTNVANNDLLFGGNLKVF